MSNRIPILLPFFTLAMCVSGCSHSSIEVRRVFPSQESEEVSIQPDSAYGRAMAQLSASARTAQGALTSIRTGIVRLPPGDQTVFAPVLAVIKTEMGHLDQVATTRLPTTRISQPTGEAVDVQARLINLAESDLSQRSQNIRDAIHRTRSQVIAVREVAQSSAGGVPIETEISSALDKLDDATTLHDKAMQNAWFIVASAKSGFGGFRQAGIYVIHPGDPEYKTLLGSRGFRRSADPLVYQEVSGLGDVSVMVVQESPGCFRVYQISNDPRTAAANIQLITQKTLHAALKYMAPVPTP